MVKIVKEDAHMIRIVRPIALALFTFVALGAGER